MPLVQKFIENDPAAAAQSLETMKDSDAIRVLSALPSRLAADVFQFLSPNHASELIRGVSPDVFREIIEKLQPTQGASIFMNLSHEDRGRFFEELPAKMKPVIVELLRYPENSAGRIMSTEFLAFHAGAKVRDVIKRLRFLTRKSIPQSYVYVIDSENHLLGVINMRDMILASSTQTLENIMQGDVVTVNAFTDREEAANVLSKIRYFSVPVVDFEGHMLGIIKADQLISDVQAEATEDIQKMFGAGGDERTMSPVFFSIRKRLPWLYVNLATAFIAASVVGIFEDIIARYTVLAVFLPVVAGQGGNAGAQSLAVVMRGLVMKEIPRFKVWSLILKETWVGLLNGATIGVVTALIAWVWHGSPVLGLVIGLAMIVNMLAAGFAGAAIPVAMKAMGLDPAQS
jgi:magnesium transporter